MGYKLETALETWPSGRRRSPAKGVGPEGSRGFESLRLRHKPFANPRRGPSGAFFLFGSKGFSDAIRLSETGRWPEIGL